MLAFKSLSVIALPPSHKHERGENIHIYMKM